MKKVMVSAVLAPLFMGSAFSAGAAEGINVFDDVTFNGEIRPRYEYADVKDDGVDAGQALTARTSLGFNAKLFGVDGLSGYAELTAVSHIGLDKYAPDTAGYETILDPGMSRVSQAYLDYKRCNTLLRFGRQMVNLDDQRFVGAVGWRQMPQTFEAATVVDQSVENLTLTGAYVWNRLGITNLASHTHETSSVLLNAKYKVAEPLTITAFGYLIGSVHNTYGLRLTGNLPVEGMTLAYDASYAKQDKASLKTDSSDDPAEIDASYYNIALNGAYEGVLFGAGYEVLGKAEDGSAKGFTAPLGTLHKFQGWADVYLLRTAGSNNEGLTDLNLMLGYAAKGFGKAQAIYHKFDAETGAADDLGSELDLLYATALPGLNNVKALVKAALFSKGDSGSDVEKYWVQLDYRF